MNERQIHMLWVTARVGTFKKTLSEWKHKSKYPERLVIKVAVDNDRQAAKLDGYDVMVTNPPYIGVAYPAYCLTTTYTAAKQGDIIMLCSDDFYPPENWDEFIYNECDDNCSLLVNDGIVAEGADAITLPIIGYNVFIKLKKIIYHKVYQHMFSDTEFFYNCRRIKALKNLRATSPIFEHRHYANNKRRKDNLDNKNQGYFYQDKDIWNKRKNLTLKQRLI